MLLMKEVLREMVHGRLPVVERLSIIESMKGLMSADDIKIILLYSCGYSIEELELISDTDEGDNAFVRIVALLFLLESRMGYSTVSVIVEHLKKSGFPSLTKYIKGLFNEHSMEIFCSY